MTPSLINNLEQQQYLSSVQRFSTRTQIRQPLHNPIPKDLEGKLHGSLLNLAKRKKDGERYL